jgi:hypothetical protein
MPLIHGRAETYLGDGLYRGVDISCKAHEFEIMQKVILALPPDLHSAITSIFCDSKAGHDYTVELRQWEMAPLVHRMIHAALIEIDGGYNGIWIEHATDRDKSLFLNPYWPADQDYFDGLERSHDHDDHN